ncbi:hypothetical protein RQP46_002258 [Phenoliferia psychrophenolica]
MEGTTIDLLYAPKPISNVPGMSLTTLKITYEAGASTPPHRHGDAFVTAVVLSGSIRSRVNDEEVKIHQAGESWTEAPGAYHWESGNGSTTESASFIATFVAPSTQTDIMPYRPRLHLTSLSRRYSSTLSRPILGIRAEDPARRWERRVPLTPSAVSSLVGQGVKVLVQPSEKRVFPDQAYAKAGASITRSLSEASLIMGIKEIPAAALEGQKSYAFFSHTHKGQPYNLPLLQAMLDTSSSRFIDYELLTDSLGVRTTAFGWLAGFSGMSDGLSLFATKALASHGAATAFLTLPRPFMVEDIASLKRELKRVGKEIEENGTPKGMGPIVVAVAGKGRVGQGARAVLDELPTTWITASELKDVVESSDTDLRRIYACQLELSDYLTDTTGHPFDRDTYRKHPSQFVSEFDTKIAPFTTILLNGAFWQPGYPRMLSTSQLAGIQSSARPGRFLSVVDVSCDFGGGLEFVTSPTTIDDPVFQFDASTNSSHRDPGLPHTTQISSIEILPSQLPLDSSTHFSAAIMPYVASLLRDPASAEPNEEAKGLRRATIVEGGKLTEKFTGLYELLKKSERVERRRKVLLLGSGLVAGPAVKVISSRSNIDLIIASNAIESAEALAAPQAHATAVFLDAGDQAGLETLVKDADVVLSLLPAPLHVGVAKLCIKNGTSLVTASYVSPEMSELHESAKAAGVVLLNELGLDPGLDHCSAMRLIQEARDSGNEITSFVSFCGGLPTPSQSNGPLGYKFSWSPRGVLTAALNPANFRLSNSAITIPSSSLLSSSFPSVPILRGFALEGLPNRDSVKYLAEYGLPEDLPTILRGTLSLIPSSLPPRAPLPPFPSRPESPLDLLSTLLASQLAYAPDEPDAVLLHHELGTRNPKTGEDELFTSTLVQYGTPGSDSAMATTVGIPIALGALLILDGSLSAKGLVSPSSPEVWRPLLKSLEDHGVKLVEERNSGRGVLEVLEKQVQARK